MSREDTRCWCGACADCLAEYPAPRREDAAGERVAQIAARLNAATPGPWTFVVNPSARHAHIYGPDDSKISDFFNGTVDLAQGNVEFIANAPSDIEYLLAALSTAMTLREIADKALKLAEEVAAAHRDRGSPDYNACEKPDEACQFCVETKTLRAALTEEK